MSATAPLALAVCIGMIRCVVLELRTFARNCQYIRDPPPTSRLRKYFFVVSFPESGAFQAKRRSRSHESMEMMYESAKSAAPRCVMLSSNLAIAIVVLPRKTPTSRITLGLTLRIRDPAARRVADGAVREKQAVERGRHVARPPGGKPAAS